MYDFAYHRPETLDAALALHAAADDPSWLAGGMTLIPTLKQRLAAPSDLIDLAALPSLTGIEVRGERADLLEALATLADHPTWLAVTAERTVSRAMGGSCSMPLAAFTRGPTAGGMQLHAAWGDPASADQGSALPLKPLVYAQETAVVRTFAEAEALGEAVAERLRAGGAFWAANAPATPAA